ncbi:Rap1a/Tai family immunity protein [uncultured Xanthomonas sp.]|uniref:Rap1a/Tai family immunity protein n=1 Tax=uncultured Xanthomonas sp. TaxID=152831 RepID=UPI0025DD8B43|nr:Rap1a/Tai family immunity protein [uncultured Xanthomonas sp.]
MTSHRTWLALPLLAALGSNSAARPPAGPWDLNGHQLLEAPLDGSLANDLGPQQPQELRVMVSSRTAAAYMLGIAAGSEGARWCRPAGQSGPPDVQALVADLGALPDARLDERASDLVAQALAKRYPCKPAKPRRPSH